MLFWLWVAIICAALLLAWLVTYHALWVGITILAGFGALAAWGLGLFFWRLRNRKRGQR